MRASTNRPVSQEIERSQDHVGARGAFFATLPYYRRIVPTELRALIPEGARRVVKRILGIKDPVVRVQELRHRLNDLGFVERALDDLTRLSESSEPVERQLAIWNLAVWHANRRSPEGSVAALALLDKGIDDIANENLRLREAVLRAECHATLGDIEAGRAVVAAALETEQHPDLHLAAANLYAEPIERLSRVNEALRLYELPELTLRRGEGALYDRLMVAEALPVVDGPKISVIVPAFNAAEHIATAMEALLAQTWTNLEVLVVDDLSTDATRDVVSAFAARDPRIRLIRSEHNRGSYVARNIALREASGEFVTTHDSDDWSHPKKIEMQARHLVSNRRVAANMSQQARATSELLFHRRGSPGHYIFDNMSSLMFRREPVLKKLGSWDSVRFGADSEFIGRIRTVFGEKSVASLPEAGPLSFQRQSESSLTGCSAFGFHGFFMGARLAYHQASRRHHLAARKLFYEFPQLDRPFAIPEPMRPVREVPKGERRRFDVILVSDFRMSGAVKQRTLLHVEAERRQGHRVGLIQLACYDLDPMAPILPAFGKLENRGEVQLIVFGEYVSCERLVLLHPPVLESFQRFIPDVEAKEIEVLVEEKPPELADPEAFRGWLDGCKANARRHFGSAGVWSSTDGSLDPLLAAE